MGDLSLGICDTLIVDVNGAGLDETLSFGVGCSEVQRGEQPRQPHGSCGDGDFLSLDILGIRALTEDTVELFTCGLGGGRTVVVGDDARAEIGLHVHGMALTGRDIGSKFLDFI